ncbi:MAG: glycosyltransferase family 9 protein [Ignavibacteria bacterium]|nr:glycosyltransferase family 9 protein [Ignavibacteria bacterium]
MSVTLMKLLDEYAGRVIVCFISFFKKKKVDSNNDCNLKNILFIKFWGIGSIVLTAPALNKVKAAYPDSKVYFLTLESNQEICSEMNTIDEVITMDISNPVKFISDLFKKVSALRKINFDMVFDFEFYTYFSAIIVSLLKINSGFGFDNLKNNRKILFTKTILFNNSKHTKDNFLNLVNADERVCMINVMSQGFANINLNQNNKNGELIITVNPNASRLAYERRLPEENFIEIVNHLANKYNFKVVLIGSKDEMKYAGEIYSRLKNKNSVNNLCGKTSVKELITLINSSVCLITNDSGPLHIASAFNVPVIAFFGPESPERYGPLSEKNLVFYKGLGCSPCMSISNSKTVNCIYDSPRCMEQFEMGEVLKKIDLFIKAILAKQEPYMQLRTHKEFGNERL